MPRLRHAVAAAMLAVLTHTTVAHAETPADPPAGDVVLATAEKAATAVTGAAMGPIMLVLDVLGIVDKHAPAGTAVTRARGTVRAPIWFSPEPPKTPLLYSSVVVAKF